MAETRLQNKSRPAKRPIGTANYSTGTGAFTWTGGKKPRSDPRGYPSQVGESDGIHGVPFPVLVAVTAIA